MLARRLFSAIQDQRSCSSLLQEVLPNVQNFAAVSDITEEWCKLVNYLRTVLKENPRI